MKVSITVLRHIIVKDNVDSFDIHSTTKQISSNKNTLAEIFESLILCQSVQKNEYNNGINIAYNKCRLHGLSPQLEPTRSYEKLQEYAVVCTTLLTNAPY